MMHGRGGERGKVDEPPVPVTELDFRRLLAEGYPERFRITMGTISLFIGAAAGLSIPYFFGQIIDALSRGKHGVLWQNVVGLAVATALSAMFSFLRAYFLNSAGEILVARLRLRVFRAVLRQEVGFFDGEQTGRLVSRLSSDTAVLKAAITSQLAVALRQLATVIGGIIYLFVMSWQLTLLLLALVPAIAISARVYGGYVRRMAREQQQKLAEASEVVEESFGGIRTVKAHCAEAGVLERYKVAILETQRLGLRTSLAWGLFISITTLLTGLAFAAIIYYGGTLVLAKHLTVGSLTSFLLFALTIAGALGGLGGVFGTLSAAAGASQRVFELLDREPKIPQPIRPDSIDFPPQPLCSECWDTTTTNNKSDQTSPSSSSPTPHTFDVEEGGGDGGESSGLVEAVDGGIGASTRYISLASSEKPEVVSLNEVVFAYPTRPDAPVLRSLSLTLHPGEVVALVGPSGHGKSTVTALLERFYDVDGGEVTVGGKRIEELDVVHWRKRIGLVSQDPLLFGTTIRENIRFARPEASNADVEAAAREANAHHFITKFPDGYNTLVGERGIKLSGGQRQRVAIARAILSAPSYLLLDEATSSLDSESEHLVQEALTRLMKGRTTLIIAHRLSTVIAANRVCLLLNGAIQAQGTHTELLASSSEYASLVSRQMRAFDVEDEEEEEEGGEEDESGKGE